MNHLFFVDLTEEYETLMDKYPHYEMVLLTDFDEIPARSHKISDALNAVDYHNHDHRVIQWMNYLRVQ